MSALNEDQLDFLFLSNNARGIIVPSEHEASESKRQAVINSLLELDFIYPYLDNCYKMSDAGWVAVFGEVA
ncbi:MAG: hypothetical protein HN790_05355 [Methylococcales bacterium]|nr:hypothetical protein [Methylococcales bacterium]